MDGTDAGSVKRAGNEAERQAAPWVEGLARAGYAAKGVVYLLVGGLALKVAFGGGQAEGSEDVLARLADSPLQRVLLGAIALGLVGYVVWRAYCAIRDPENDGAGTRAFYGITALIYGGLAWTAARMALDGGGNGGGGGDAAQTATVLSMPMGQWLVGAAGVGVALYGFQQIWKAYTADLDDRLDLSALDAERRRWVVRGARVGLAARGVVLVIVGGFFLSAAWQHDPSEARGLGGALATLRDQSYGPWLLAAVAAGLVAYGGYNLVRARYRRITPQGG